MGARVDSCLMSSVECWALSGKRRGARVCLQPGPGPIHANFAPAPCLFADAFCLYLLEENSLRGTVTPVAPVLRFLVHAELETEGDPSL